MASHNRSTLPGVMPGTAPPEEGPDFPPCIIGFRMRRAAEPNNEAGRSTTPGPPLGPPGWPGSPRGSVGDGVVGSAGGGAKTCA